ncbi:MAG TPA: SURF1 family cytochrome oxidase biogenesis protein [Caulobacteraceae bacterium]|jgi:surfeit locus 1 family protein|nr:SURF1 family cytochrome oxidase biogenesis protein [Caulobacteraceae bacterium]
MTSERPRFPVVLTLLTAAAFAIIVALGVWQLQRLDWKHQKLAQIAALQHAAPQPLGPVLAHMTSPEAVTFTRVIATCAPAPAAPAQIRMTSDNGDWIARVSSACALAGLTAYDGVIVDRGFLAASRGSTATPVLTLPAPVTVTGVLFAHPDAFPASSLKRPAPVVLVAEAETPAAPGVVPAPYVAGAADQLEYVGAYAPTWFGLAAALACIYAAMLWRRYHPKP